MCASHGQVLDEVKKVGNLYKNVNFFLEKKMLTY